MENNTQTITEEQMQEKAPIGDLDSKEIKTVMGGLNATAKGAIAGGVAFGSAAGVATSVANRKNKDRGITAGLGAAAIGGGAGATLGAVFGLRKERLTKVAPSAI